MSKVFRLVSVQLWAVLGDILSIGDKRKKKPKALYTGIVLFAVGMSVIAFFYCFAIGKVLLMYNCIRALPSLIMAAAYFIILITTVLRVKGTIFGFRDYDMVMSMPVHLSGIVASRLIILYLINLIFEVMIMVPMMAAYGILVRPDILFYIIGTVEILFLPLIPIVLASVIGTVITYVSTKFRHSNIATVIIAFAFLLAMIILPYTIQGSDRQFADFSLMLSKKINMIYPLAGMYTSAVCDGDLIALLVSVAISVAAFIVYSFVIGKLFKKINSRVMTGTYHTNYKMGQLRQSTPLKALYVKEFRRFLSSPLYVMNTAFGIVLLTVAAVASLFFDLNKLLGDSQSVSLLSYGGPMLVSFCVMMSSTTMASISLEGKNLWIIKSLPITPGDVFKSKLYVNLTIIAPALIDAVILGFTMKMGFVKGIIMILVTVICGLFTALLGLAVNLKLPNFTWSSEAVVIKQSAASLITIFTGMGAVGLQAAFLAVFNAFIPAYLLYTCLIVILDIILYKLLKGWGEKHFAQI